MAKFDYDLVIVGGGSGGVAMARRAAMYGARVALCEEDRYGGTCVHRGCVPKKLLVYGAHFAEEFASARGYGWTVPEPTFDWATLVAAKDKELERLNTWYNKMLEENRIERVLGKARFVDRHTVAVGDRQVTGETLVVAVGGWPFVPDIPGKEHVITSNEAFHLEKLPQRIVIVGSGYIGVEFAGIFNNLGSEVTLTFRSARLLPKFDEDVRQTLTEEMQKKGIRILAGAKVKEIKPGLRLVTDQGEVEGDTVMYATGRKPNTRGLGLEELGVKLAKNGAVVVDDDLRTSVDNIYALGDCIDKVALTPVAIAEGRGLAETLYNRNPTRVSYDNIATAVFSQPPVGTVGLSEEEARKRHPGQVAIYRTKFRPMKHSLTGKDEKVMLKLVVHKETDRVLGCHMVGPDSPEIMQAMGVAMTCGATKKQFDQTIALHPSTAEEFVLMREPVKEVAPA